MAKYKKADNCGPVPYPDQSGRYLGEGEVAEDDVENNWAPLLPLGFVVLTESDVTEDRQETPEELAVAVEVPELTYLPLVPTPELTDLPLVPTPEKTVTEMAKDAASKSMVEENAGETVMESATKAAKGKKKKNGKKKGTKSFDISGD